MWNSRKIYKIFLGGLVSWCVATVYFYTSYSIDLSLDATIFNLLHSPLSADVLRSLMAPEGERPRVVNPLLQMVLHGDDRLQFYSLPKSKTHITYTEVTSANRDTSYPLAPDFSFHISYGEREVVIYQDYTPGCVYRIYLFPVLPRHTGELHKITNKDLESHKLRLEVDGAVFEYGLNEMASGETWPFLYPVNTRHPFPSSGMGSYTPFCYRQSMRISYIPPDKQPPLLFEQTINCSRNDLECPIHIYSSVSRHRFASGTTVQSFADTVDPRIAHGVSSMSAGVSKLLEQPENRGPDRGDRCIMECVTLCGGCRQVLYASDQPGVISALRIRVFDSFTGIPMGDWSKILLTAVFDNATVPQINRVSLGMLFGASGSHNEFMGAALGWRKRYCTYEDGIAAMPKTTHTGYIYFPMPFWKSALFYVESTDVTTRSHLVCSHISTVDNYYQEEETAYFHAKSTYFTENVQGWRELLSLDNSWGHVVGLLMHIDNLRAAKDASLNARWAALQSDMNVFIDGHKSATIMGTGLEDYFSYAHGFALAENTTYSFVGVPHTAPKRKEPLTWHCYRLHLLDPIPFRKSLLFMTEGTGEFFHNSVKDIPYADYQTRLTNQQGGLSHVVLYYAKHHPQATPTLNLVNTFTLGDSKSEAEHHYQLMPSASAGNDAQHVNIKSGSIFSKTSVRYIGACHNNQQYDKTGRSFNPGDKFSFKMTVTLPNKGALLRREFYSLPRRWNETAIVFINQKLLGAWYIPMGSLVERYSLQEDDMVISSDFTRDSVLNIEIHPRTLWQDISYSLFILQ